MWERFEKKSWGVYLLLLVKKKRRDLTPRPYIIRFTKHKHSILQLQMADLHESCNPLSLHSNQKHKDNYVSIGGLESEVKLSASRVEPWHKTTPGHAF